MKMRFFISAVIVAGLLFSCDKVDNPLKKEESTGIDWSLYPNGDSEHYAQNEWPVFPANVNTLRNVIIEDFTGHKCSSCPGVASAVHSFVETNPERFYDVAIHSGPLGALDLFFQSTSSPHYTNVFYNDEGLSIGQFLGSMPGTVFIGNPKITISRIKQNNDLCTTPASLNTIGNNAINSSLKVNIQAATNYYPSTRGLFLHTEIDKLDQTLSDNLYSVVYLVEDSLVAYQTVSGSDIPDYVHRNIMRGCLDKKPFGQKLGASSLNANGKYYLNYAYKLPDQYAIDNMHLLIYVYDKSTNEILQVIKHHL